MATATGPLPPVAGASVVVGQRLVIGDQRADDRGRDALEEDEFAGPIGGIDGRDDRAERRGSIRNTASSPRSRRGRGDLGKAQNASSTMVYAM
jgi:hypothetical protein